MFSFFQTKDKRKALVIEGGGMRGVFIAGVLQSFVDHNYFPWKIIGGSSAGALMGTAYAAGQIYIARDLFFTDVIDGNFISISNVLKKKKHIVNLDWLIDRIAFADEPLNVKALRKNCPVIITATNVKDATDPETIYLNTHKDDIFTALKATAALPYLYRGFVEYKDYKFLDGAMIDPLPYDYIKRQGFKDKDITIILTRPRGYRKKSESFWVSALYESYYKEEKYRPFLKVLDNRFMRYNAFLDDLEQNHPDLNIVYPPKNFRVDRITRDPLALMKGFQQGVAAGKRYLFEVGHIRLRED